MSSTRNSLRGLLVTIAMLGGVSAVPIEQTSVHTIPLVRNRVPVTEKGKVVSHKTSYVGSIAVGSSRQSFKVIFDTGSGHVVLPSVECETQACMNHARYDQELSPDSLPINMDKSPQLLDEAYDEITVHYGTGQIDGSFVMENVCVGSLNSVGLCTRMGFIQASEMSDEPFDSLPADGIFGLGLSSLALDPEFNFFSMLARSGSLAQVGMFIGLGDDESELSVGGHNPARLASPLSWVPVTNADLGYWQVELLGLRIDGQEMDFCKDGGCRAIIDSGASHIGVPPYMEDLVEDLLSLPANSEENCKTAPGRHISFELPGVNLTIGPDHYMRTMPLHTDVHSGPIRSDAHALAPQGLLTNELSTMLSSEKTAPDDLWCRPLLTTASLPPQFGGKVFILGEPVFRQYYTIFDGASPALGFGLASQASANVGKTDDAIILMQQSVSTKKGSDEVVLLQVVVVAKKVMKKRKVRRPQLER